jgi:hypothetical protein
VCVCVCRHPVKTSIAVVSDFRNIERREELEEVKARSLLANEEGQTQNNTSSTTGDEADVIDAILASDQDEQPASVSMPLEEGQMRETKNERMMNALHAYVLYLFPVEEHHLFRSSTPHADWVKLMALLLPWLIRYVPVKADVFAEGFEKWMHAEALEVAKKEIDDAFVDSYAGHSYAFLMQRMNVLINQIEKRRHEVMARNNGK